MQSEAGKLRQEGRNASEADARSGPRRVFFSEWVNSDTWGIYGFRIVIKAPAGELTPRICATTGTSPSGKPVGRLTLI
jgi:hypothetical protein